MNWTEQIWMGLEARRLVGFVVVMAVIVLVGMGVRRALRAWGKKLQTRGRTVSAAWIIALSRAAVLVTLAAGIAPALAVLNPPDTWSRATSIIVQLLVTLAVGAGSYVLVDAVEAGIQRRWHAGGSEMDRMLGPLVRKSIRITIVVLVVVQVAQILSGSSVTSLLAGLGVGGLAVALAAQDTIKNFFGSLVLLADKPFEIGQRVVVDGHDGTVESVGFRSTRIRTLDGHQVTIPNGELANRTILNIGRRPYIRRILNIGLTFDTPPEKIQRALDILNELLRDHPGVRPDFPPRVFFSEISAYALNVMVIYWHHPADYWSYMKFSERLNLEIIRRFKEEGIRFAFPSQTLYLANDGAAPQPVLSSAPSVPQ
ncbi:MAG: mechanosensitive ion channel family protein [Kiritimatiellae bacterium]|nr:mechanosensitive ion channel family protein [Kiritimatiellia bacterium]